MDYGKNRTWLEVDLAVLRENYRKIQQRVSPAVGVMAVVKADAYGLGAVKATQALAAAGCRQFGTAYLEEAMELRENGIQAPILVLGSVPLHQVEVAVEHRLTLQVSSLAMAAAFDQVAARMGRTLGVQIAADVGMARFGLPLEGRVEAAAEEAAAICRLPHLKVEGYYTHLQVLGTTPEGQEFDRHQFGLFREFTDRLYAAGFRATRHCACSAMLLLHPQSYLDQVRVSALLFGLQNPLGQPFQLPEVVSLRSRVVHLKQVPQGSPVGYGPHYTQRDTRLAIIPIGFGDGLHRSVSHKAPVLIRGQRATVFGKLCMDFCMVDVTDIPAEIGDEVTLIGESGGQSVSIFEYAALYGGTACEVTTSLGKRINRIYLHEQD